MTSVASPRKCGTNKQLHGRRRSRTSNSNVHFTSPSSYHEGRETTIRHEIVGTQANGNEEMGQGREEDGQTSGAMIAMVEATGGEGQVGEEYLFLGILWSSRMRLQVVFCLSLHFSCCEMQWR